ncbi:hypothetical protein LJB94_01070 [Odoribacter sp. OttesenSCG-928-G04]|nr:hypothetical protein [Odoribacter sp. OttesenSCG-928-G04]
MNYTFEISMPDRSGFRAEIAIGGSQTFQQFHNKIIEILGCDDAQITSFYTIDKSGDRGREITLMDMSMGEEESDALVMNDTKIEDVINASCIELEYIYDFFNDKYLKVEYAGEYVSDSSVVLPACLALSGEPPMAAGDSWGYDSEEDGDYDDSFMEEFSGGSRSRGGYGDDDDDDFGDDYKDDDDDYGYGGDDDFGGSRHENIDDYLDRM